MTAPGDMMKVPPVTRCLHLDASTSSASLTVYIVGGTNAVSAAQEGVDAFMAVLNEGDYTISFEACEWCERYATAAAVAGLKTLTTFGTTPWMLLTPCLLLVVTVSLMHSPLHRIAHNKKMPILLPKAESLNADAKATLTDLDTTFDRCCHCWWYCSGF